MEGSDVSVGNLERGYWSPAPSLCFTSWQPLRGEFAVPHIFATFLALPQPRVTGPRNYELNAWNHQLTLSSFHIIGLRCFCPNHRKLMYHQGKCLPLNVS